jgi:hypothetical protein
MSKRAKAKSNSKRTIETITDEIKKTLSNDRKNIIVRGDLLIEAKALVEHGQWLPWLEENFDMSEGTAERAMRVARLADKFCRLQDIDLANLPKGVLYELSHEGRYPDLVVEAVLAEAADKRVTIDRLYDISEELDPTPEEPEEERQRRLEAEEQEQQRQQEQLQERQQERQQQAQDEAEAEEILDGPPPPLPPPAPPPAPADFTLAQFDKALKALLELHTKALVSFAKTEHSVEDLARVSEFISAVAQKVGKSGGEDEAKETGAAEPEPKRKRGRPKGSKSKSESKPDEPVRHQITGSAEESVEDRQKRNAALADAEHAG